MPKKGKKGTEQRVKGNVQAASSGRMSELLKGEGFIGFETLSASLNDGSAGLDESLLRVHSQFQVVLKQMGKKDTVTKIKALQEYISLCEQEPVEGVTSSLQLWPLMYTKLSTDTDRKIRELSHVALGRCGSKVGRGLAPHIRSLIGPLVTGACDPYPPSSGAAREAFSACFPPAKETDVIRFGLKSIVNYCSDIILKESPDTFTDPKTMPEDERVQRYERTVVMAIGGYGYALEKLGRTVEEEGLMEIWRGLVTEKRLWKLLKHSNHSIRNAVIILIKALISSTQYVNHHPDTFCPLLLSQLSEPHSSVVQSLWETSLLLISTVDSWHQHVNIQKALLPGVWQLLGNGGHGNGSIIYPCLLPLLSQLLKVPDTDTIGLSINFITRLKSGLSSEVSKGSSSDTNSLIMSLVECSSYCMDTNEGGDTSGVTPFISHLISIIIELIDDLFLVPAVQLEGVSNCIVWLINLLVKRSVRYQSDMTHLDQLRSELTHRLCQRLAISDTIKQSLNSISTLLIKFYPPPTSATPTMAPPTSPLTLVSPSTSQFMLPLTCELISDCLTRYSNSLSHIKLASSLLSAISHMTSSWVDHVTRLVGCPYKEGVEGDAHYSLAKYLIELLDGEIEAESGKETEKWGVSVGGVSLEMLAWSFSESEMREELLVDCCVIVLYAGRGGERGGVSDVHVHVLSTESVRRILMEICQVNTKLLPAILNQLSIHHHDSDFTYISTQLHSSLLPTSSSLTNPHYSSFLHSLFLSPSLSSQSLLFTDIIHWLVDLLSVREGGEGEGGTVPVDKRREKFQLLKLFSLLNSKSVSLCLDEMDRLLSYLLKWLLKATDIELCVSVVSTYHHLVDCYSSSNDINKYLNNAAGIIMDSIDNNNNNNNSDITNVLFHGVVFQCLHSSLLFSSWTLFQPILDKAMKDKTNYITPQLLFQCCRGDLYFSPSLSSLSLTSSLPLSLSLCLLPSLGSCDLPSLQHLIGEGLDGYPLVDVLLLWLPEGGRSEGEVNEEVWLMGVVTSLLSIVILESLEESLLSSLILPVVGSSLKSLVQSRKSSALPTVQSLLKRSSDQFISLLSLSQLLEHYKSQLDDEEKNVVSEDSKRGGEVKSYKDDAIIQLILEESDPNLWTVLAPIKNRLDIPLIISEDPCQVSSLLYITSPSTVQYNESINTVLSSIVQYQDQLNLFGGGNLLEVSRDPMIFSVIRLLVGVVSSHESISQYWDFLSCTLVTIVQLLVDCSEPVSLEGVVLCCRGLQLLESLQSIFSNKSPAHLINEHSEWVEFFSHSIVDLLLPIFIKYLTTPPSYEVRLLRYYTCRILDLLATGPSIEKWEELVVMVTRSPLYFDQLVACKLARRSLLLLRIVTEEEEKLKKESKQISVSSFQSVIDSILEKIDLNLIFNDHHDIVHTTSYVLLWLLIIETIGKCHLEVRVQLIDWVKGCGLLFPLLQGITQYCDSAVTTNMNIETIKVSMDSSLSLLSNSLYMSIAQYIPHLLRQWYLTLDRQTSNLISSFTAKHVSQRLWRQEVESMSSNTKIGNLEVRVCAGVSEINVVYRVDEFSIELTVCIPDNYPLSPPTIKEGKRAKVDLSLWRKWLLQLSSFVANQNGSILEGLLLWKSNLDKHFAGLDDCMICFSIIHGSNYSLPKMICRTCKKRFHSSCLYKWFSTSNKSSCPLCRNIF